MIVHSFYFAGSLGDEMPLITYGQISASKQRKYGQVLASKQASVVFSEETFYATQPFTVFLSHSYQDRNLNSDNLLGLKAFLEEFNYTVYVDWIIDHQLSREDVNAATAQVLRRRMDHSRCLLFATSTNSTNSRWMPWELGYKDGQSGEVEKLGRVAVLPLSSSSGEYTFAGQEYLGIYPYIQAGNSKDGGNRSVGHWD